MAFPNDNFRPPLPNPPFASTPNSVRTQRPRFAYAGPHNYPRPGSSASKPNPDLSVSDIMRSRYNPSGHMNDSMIGNCNDSYMDTSLPDYNDSFQADYSSGSYQSQDSVYYTCNESFSNSPRQPLLSAPQIRPQHPYKTNFFEPDVSVLPPISTEPVRFKPISNVTDPYKRRPFYKKKDVKPIGVFSKKDDGVSKHVWRCSLCDIVFTSSVPYNMHKRGSKHAKKLKLQEATKTVQSQVEVKTKEVEVVGNAFRCELCGILANGPYQLKMHLEGLKHKTKLLQQTQDAVKSKIEENKAKKQKTDKKEDTKANGDEENDENLKKTDASANAKKTEASVAKPVGCPTNTDFSCGVCELFLNSDAQLQQHLAGRFHKAKVEGTTLPFHGKKKAAIRKAVEIKFVKSSATDNKTSEPMEVCKTNPIEGSIETNVPPGTVSELQPETAKDVVQSETPEPTTSKNSQPEITEDAVPKTSKDS